MNIDHDTFDDRLAELDDLTNLPTELADHAEGCARCTQRLDLAQRIRSTSRLLVPADLDTDAIVPAVLATTHPRKRSRAGLLAAAASVAVVVGGVGIVLTNQTDEPNDRLAEIADEYRDSDGVRFVYATEATVDIAAEYNLTQVTTGAVEPLGSRTPTCAESSPDPDVSGGLDLAPIVDALSVDDPCLALALIDETVAQSAIDTYTALATSIDRTTNELNDINEAEPRSPLVDAAGAAYRDQLQDELDQADEALDALANSFTALSATLEPLAKPTPSSPSGTGTEIEDRLVALSADTSAATEAIIETDSTITWTQIATGTWTTTGIDISGTTEHDDRSEPYTGVDGDPLGLAAIVLSRPDTLTAILDSAPPSTTDTIEWTLPDDLIAGSEAWTATAKLDNSQLHELLLSSTRATITFTPAR